MKPFTIPGEPTPAGATALWFTREGHGPDPIRFVLHTMEPMDESGAPKLGLRIQDARSPLFGQGRLLVDGGFMLDRESARLLTMSLCAWMDVTEPGNPLSVTHEDACVVAEQRKATSNLARCYLAYNEALAYSEERRVAGAERIEALSSELASVNLKLHGAGIVDSDGPTLVDRVQKLIDRIDVYRRNAQTVLAERDEVSKRVAELEDRAAPTPLEGRGTPYSLYECKLALQKADAPTMDPYYADLINWLIERVEKLQSPEDQH